MNCKSCNSPLSNEAVFCPNCGALVEEDLEATGLLIEEEKETGLLSEEKTPADEPVYTPEQLVYTPPLTANPENINPAYVNPAFNQQPQQNYYNPTQKQANQSDFYAQPALTYEDAQGQNLNMNQTVVEQPTLKSCYKKFWNNYTNFNGRARRSEYWFVVLANFLIALINVIPYVGQALYSLYALAIIVPTLALIVRRLHDLGKEWYNIFFFLIPIAGPIIILVWMCTDSQIGANKFGENPKGIN